jgi:ankyrin repeat protein
MVDIEGNTNLHLSAMQGHLSSARMLIQCGANVDIHDCSGYTPLHCAVENDLHQIVQLLVEARTECDGNGNGPEPDVTVA